MRPNPCVPASMLAVNRAVADLRGGDFVVIESETDAAVVQAAEAVTPWSLAELARRGRGELRLALTARRAAALGLSAGLDRVVALPLSGATDAATVRGLADPTCIMTAAGVLGTPAAVIEAPEGTIAGAAIALAKCAQLLPAVLMAALPLLGRLNLERWARGAGIRRVAADAVDRYPRLAALTLRSVAEARVPLAGAEDTRIIAFRPGDGGAEQYAIFVGEPAEGEPVLCRLHSACLSGDLLGSLRCDCGPQLRAAVEQIGLEGAGVALYLAQEGIALVVRQTTRRRNARLRASLDVCAADLPIDGGPAEAKLPRRGSW